jgi:hypothetical protein
VTELVITDVVEEIEEWQNRYGDFMYSVVAFAGQELVKANKKDRDRAVELQGLLKEAIGVPREFNVEPAGTSKNGYAKWKFVGFGNASQNGQSPDVSGVNGRVIALQAAAVWAHGLEWGEFETAFQRMYALLGGIATETSNGEDIAQE